MVRFSSILIVYFVVGSTMWGAGIITWDNAGVGDYIINDPASDSDSGLVDGGARDDLESLGGPIGNVVGTLGGGLIAVWSIMNKLVGSIFWPVTVLLIVDAPLEAVVLGGGTLSMAFVASFIRTIRGSA